MGGGGIRGDFSYLVEDEPALLPLGAVSRLLVEIAGHVVVVVGALGQHHQLAVVDAHRALHLGAQHVWSGGGAQATGRECCSRAPLPAQSQLRRPSVGE